jgi:hypothetical protein
LGVPAFVVTHTVPREWVYEGSPFTFVTDGVESAVELAKAVAGDKDVGVSAASIAQQSLKAGLLDEIHIDLVPVPLGGASGSSATWATSPSSWNARGWSRRRVSRTSSSASSRRADGMRLPLTSAKITNESIREALVDLLGQSIAESKAICIPTAIKETDGEVEVVSEGEWKLFDKRQSR